MNDVYAAATGFRQAFLDCPDTGFVTLNEPTPTQPVQSRAKSRSPRVRTLTSLVGMKPRVAE